MDTVNADSEWEGKRELAWWVRSAAPWWALEYLALGRRALDHESGDDEDRRIQRSLPARTEPLASGHSNHEQLSYWSQRKRRRIGLPCGPCHRIAQSN